VTGAPRGSSELVLVRGPSYTCASPKRASDPCGEGPNSPDGAARCGAPLRDLETVRSATWLPSFKSSPWILGAPRRGFASAIRLTRPCPSPEPHPSLVRLLAPHYARTEDEGRALIREMLGSSADIIPDLAAKRLRVRVHALANPRSNEALVKLCDTLNALEVQYPGTDLTLAYEGPGVA
jgi:hypothetical protein